MAMTTTHFKEKQTEHGTLVDQIVDLIRSPDFKHWCLKVHNTVKYDELATQIHSFNQELKDNKTNIVEWYLKCQQLNADLVANLLAAVATQVTEKITDVPIIKQLTYLIDQVVICGLNCAHFVLHHGEPNEMQIQKMQDPSWLQAWYADHIAPSIREIQDAIHSIRLKHDTKGSLSPEHKRLSSLAAAVLITGSLIKLQAHIVTGLLSIPAKFSGEQMNAVIKKLDPNPALLFMGNTIKELVKFIVQIPFEAEAVLLKQLQGFDKVLADLDTTLNDFDDGITKQGDHPKFKM